MASPISIVPHQCCELSAAELEFAQRTATGLLRQNPDLRIESLFQEFVPESIENAACLHVDDLTEIQRAIIALHDEWTTAGASSGNGPSKSCADRLREAISKMNARG